MRSRASPEPYSQQVRLGQDLYTVYRRGSGAPSAPSDDRRFTGTGCMAGTNWPWFSRDRS